jgi:hypothetical protein
MHRPRRILTRVATYALFLLGLSLIITSAIYASSFLAILGLAIIFWACILLYITPVKHVPLTLLQASADASTSNIERVITELNLTEKAVYLPPKNLKNINSSLIFIPISPTVNDLQDNQKVVESISEIPPSVQTQYEEPTTQPTFTPETPTTKPILSLPTPQASAIALPTPEELPEKNLETPSTAVSMLIETEKVSSRPVSEEPANTLQIPAPTVNEYDKRVHQSKLKITLLPEEKPAENSLVTSPETPKTELPSPEPSLPESSKTAETTPEKPIDTTTTPAETLKPVSTQPETTNGNRLVFLVNTPKTDSAVSTTKTIGKLVFVFDVPETPLSTPEPPIENKITPSEPTPEELSPESVPEPSPTETSSEEPETTMPQQEEPAESLPMPTPEVPEKSSPAIEPTSEQTSAFSETQKSPKPPEVPSAEATEPIVAPTAEPLLPPPEVPKTQLPSSKPTPPLTLQLGTEVEMATLLEMLNKEKDLLMALKSQECWNCKSTEKTVINYSAGIGNKGEVKLACKKCGAILTFNYKNA